jgi:hypothetical protein
MVGPFKRNFFSGIVVFMMLSGTVNAQTGLTTANGVGSQFELVFWQSVNSSDDRAQIDAYLARYPDGTFAALARAKLAALDRARGPVIAPAPRAPAVAVIPAPNNPAPSAVAPALPPPVPTAPVIAAAPVGAPKPAPTAIVVEGSLSDQLRALGQSQGLRSPATATVSLPLRPVFAPVASITLPPQFCSAVERNAFHDSSYRPVVDAASANNLAAVAHMGQLRQLHEAAKQRGDVGALNALAVESQAYEAMAQAAFAQRTGFDAMFSRLLAVPIVDCGAKP